MWVAERRFACLSDMASDITLATSLRRSSSSIWTATIQINVLQRLDHVSAWRDTYRHQKRCLAWHSRGRRFNSAWLHHNYNDLGRSKDRPFSFGNLIGNSHRCPSLGNTRLNQKPPFILASYLMKPSKPFNFMKANIFFEGYGRGLPFDW